MKVVGLIAEYNPFHSGHLFHIEKARHLSHADFVLVVMSGNFVQRGTPALFDKYTRTEMALLCGADAVIELPVRFSCASAEYFACGAVFLLELLGIADFLCFGSESGNLRPLQSIAQSLTKESPAFQKTIQTYLKKGFSYPAARSKALFHEISKKAASQASAQDTKKATSQASAQEDASSSFELSRNKLTSFLSEPNNILGIEYLKALTLIQSRIIPLTIQRQEAGYHDKQLYQNFASATALRDQLLSQNPEAVRSYIPKAAFPVLEREYHHSFPILSDDFSLPLYYKIRSDIEKGIPLSSYQDISPDLEARIRNKLDQFTSFDSFATLLKTKQYTRTRINRCLLHILLDIKKPLPLATKTNPQTDPQATIPPDFPSGIPTYARLLGFRKSSSALLSAIKTHSVIPLLTKTADAQNTLFHWQPISSNPKNAPSDLQSTPSNLQNTPSDLQSTPSNLQNTPSDLQSTPSNLQNTPSDLQNTLSNFQKIYLDKQHLLPEDASSLFQQDCFAADLYRKVQELKFHTTLATEFTHPLIRIP